MKRITPKSMRNFYLFINVLIWLVLCLTASSELGYAQKPPRFPQIKAAKMTFWISGNKTTSSEIIVKTVQDKPAYRLSAYAVSLDNEVVDSISVELNGIGEPSTRFDTKYEPDLLNPDRWGHGAGDRKILPKELDPKNAQARRHRVFVLRRMRIDVVVSDVRLNESVTGILKAKITITVTPASARQSRPSDVPRVAQSRIHSTRK